MIQTPCGGFCFNLVLVAESIWGTDCSHGLLWILRSLSSTLVMPSRRNPEAQLNNVKCSLTLGKMQVCPSLWLYHSVNPLIMVRVSIRHRALLEVEGEKGTTYIMALWIRHYLLLSGKRGTHMASECTCMGSILYPLAPRVPGLEPRDFCAWKCIIEACVCVLGYETNLQSPCLFCLDSFTARRRKTFVPGLLGLSWMKPKSEVVFLNHSKRRTRCVHTLIFIVSLPPSGFKILDALIE